MLALLSVTLLLGSLTEALPYSAITTRHDSLPFSTNSISLSRQYDPAAYHSSELRKRWYGTDVPLSGPLGGNIVVGIVQVGTQNFTVRFDTGSADLWVPGPNITCPDAVPGLQSNASNPAQGLGVCAFKGQPYNISLNPAYEPLDFANNFNLTYGGGTVSGVGARDNVTLAGITVPDQIFGIVNQSSTVFGWGGTNDGIFGLSGKRLTSIHYGSNGANDTVDEKGLYLYDPWFDNAWKMGLVDPYVTFLLKAPTLEQGQQLLNISDYGVLTIGGIPKCAPQSNTTVKVPNVNVTLSEANGTNITFNWWAAAIDKYVFPGSDSLSIQDNSSPHTIFDSGQNAISIPPKANMAFHANIVPEPTLNKTTGMYFALCNATVPDLGVVIGGVEFTIPGQDLLTPLPQGPDIPPALDGVCTSVIGPSLTGDDRLYMGDPFFWNVMITKDYKEEQLYFTQNEQ